MSNVTVTHPERVLSPEQYVALRGAILDALGATRRAQAWCDAATDREQTAAARDEEDRTQDALWTLLTRYSRHR